MEVNIIVKLVLWSLLVKVTRQVRLYEYEYGMFRPVQETRLTSDRFRRRDWPQTGSEDKADLRPVPEMRRTSDRFRRRGWPQTGSGDKTWPQTSSGDEADLRPDLEPKQTIFLKDRSVRIRPFYKSDPNTRICNPPSRPRRRGIIWKGTRSNCR